MFYIVHSTLSTALNTKNIRGTMMGGDYKACDMSEYLFNRLIFVLSADLAYSEPGDIDPDTANLTSQGLQRSLMMATYLKEQVLGEKNVTAIYALEPMTHVQTVNNHPDMAGIWSIQPFALLNRITPIFGTDTSYEAYSRWETPAYPPTTVI